MYRESSFHVIPTVREGPGGWVARSVCLAPRAHDHESAHVRWVVGRSLLRGAGKFAPTRAPGPSLTVGMTIFAPHETPVVRSTKGATGRPSRAFRAVRRRRERYSEYQLAMAVTIPSRMNTLVWRAQPSLTRQM